MALWGWFVFSRNLRKFASRQQRPRRGKVLDRRRRIGFEQLEDRTVPSAVIGAINPNETVDTSLTPLQLAQALVGTGVSVSNVQFTGGTASTGSFNFKDPSVIGFSQGILLSSGSAADVVGPNLADWTSTDFGLPGDPDLDALSTYPTHDAAVLEFDFVPTANQVTFQYAFASDEYPEWVNTVFNDVFAFLVNGTNYATVRQVAGDPSSPFVPVAVNNINNGNALYPDFVPARPDLFRMNYFDPAGPSALDLELDGITSVLTFQAPVNPGVVNHMKLAIADASDGIYDSAVFIQAGSLISNENPVADLSVEPESGPAPLTITAVVEGEDPNGLPLTYSIDWGDGSNPSTGELPNETALVDHTFAVAGDYVVTLTVSNGTLVGTSTEDVHVTGATAQPVITLQPKSQNVVAGQEFTFKAAATGSPAPTVLWQVSTDGGYTFQDIPGATSSTYSGTASLEDSGNLYQAVFTNENGSATTNAAMLSVATQQTTITVTGGTFIYDGAAHAATATATDAEGEPLEGTFTFTYNGSATQPTDAGVYAIVATFTNEDTGSQAIGYGSIVIKPATPLLTVVGGSFTYDGMEHPASATALGVDGMNQVAGDFSFTYNGSPTAAIDAGTYVVTATFTSSDANYANATEASIITIAQAKPTMSVADATFTYDGNAHGVSASATGVNGEPLGPVVVTYAGASDMPVNAGTYAVVAAFSGNSNYEAGSADATLVINRASVVLTVTGGTYTYDGNSHEAVVTLTGVNGEALGPVAVTYNGGAALPVNAASYAVAASFAGDGNYEPDSGTAIVVINRATPTLTVTGGTFAYDGQPHPATTTLVGVKSEALGPVVILYNGSAAVPVSPGTYAVTASFAGDGNYNPVSGTATILITSQTIVAHGGGYWKNHTDAWAVSELVLGDYTYSKAELLALLSAPTQGDARLILVKQLIAAKLNVASGCDLASVQDVIGHADQLLAGLDRITLGSKKVAPSSALGRLMVADADLLEHYNEGELG